MAINRQPLLINFYHSQTTNWWFFFFCFSENRFRYFVQIVLRRPLAIHNAQYRVWSHCVDIQPDLSLCWTNVIRYIFSPRGSYLSEALYFWNAFFALYFARKLSSNKALFQTKTTDIFLISPWKHMLWVLIRSASLRHF